MRIESLAMTALLALVVTGAAAHGGVLFFVNDPSGFAAASTSDVLMGTENWSSAGNAVAGPVAEPLRPGIANGVFPNGVNAATGITVQSNSHASGGANVTAPVGMYYAPAGFTGLSGNVQPSNQISSNASGASFDMLFATVGNAEPRSLSFSPMYYRSTTGNSATLTVQVFDSANALLGATTVPNVADVLENAFLGVVTTNGDTLGRVNIGSGPGNLAGADNIAVYAAPEGSAAAGGASAIFALFVFSRGPGSRLRSWINSDCA